MDLYVRLLEVALGIKLEDKMLNCIYSMGGADGLGKIPILDSIML